MSLDADKLYTSKQLAASAEEQRAMNILQNSCEYKNNKYTAGLLWKDDRRVMPNSLPIALKRLQCLNNKMAKNTKLAIDIQNQIENLVAKGYAVKLDVDAIHQTGGNIWYLPIFTVRNPHKPNKARLVWDAAARSAGFALNDFLIKGPDLLAPLLRILFNFRMRAIGICADIA